MVNGWKELLPEKAVPGKDGDSITLERPWNGTRKVVSLEGRGVSTDGSPDVPFVLRRTAGTG